jgi:hypothetical protein
VVGSGIRCAPHPTLLVTWSFRPLGLCAESVRVALSR